MKGSQLHIRLASEEDDRIADQQLEFEALNQVNNEIDQIEHSLLWKTKPLKIIQKITIFITKMKHFSASYRFKVMSKNIFNLIGDQSSSFSYYLNNNMFYQSPQLFQQIKYSASQTNPLWWKIYQFMKKDTTILLPADSFLFMWDLILMFVTIINIFYVPVQLAFELDEQDLGTVYILFSIIPSCVFVLDLILCFFKGYYEKGILKTKKSDIFWHYIKGDFAIDVLIILPFILGFFGYHYANYLMMIRITRVRRTMHTIEEISNFKEKSAIIYQLFCLIYSLLLISHFCACFFHYLAVYEIEQGSTYTWLHAQNIIDADNYVKYFTSLYWVTITSMTVGYGDVVPVTISEKIVVTVITFLVTGVFGYALGMIQSIFYKMAEQQNINDSKLRLVSTHIKARGLNPQLQFRVRKYIEYYLQFKQEEELDLDELMGQLNPRLKKEVQIAMYYRFLKQSKTFGANFNDETLMDLCQKIHEKTFAPEEALFKRDSIPDKFFIILHGRLKSRLNHSAIKRYKSGGLVCEREFFLQDHLGYDIIASTFVQVAYLNYNDFIEIIKENDQVYQQYRYMLDTTLYGQASQQIICEACQSHHYFNHCPLLFLQKNIQKTIRQYNESSEQERLIFKRFQKKQNFKLYQIRDKAFEQIKKYKSQNGIQLNTKYLGLLGFQQFRDDDSEQTSKQYIGSTSFNEILGDQNLNLQDPIKEQQKYFVQDIDQVQEFEIYYPYYNISKILKLLNKQTLYARIIEKIRNHKNRFASLIAQKLMQRIW